MKGTHQAQNYLMQIGFNNSCALQLIQTAQTNIFSHNSQSMVYVRINQVAQLKFHLKKKTFIKM